MHWLVILLYVSLCRDSDPTAVSFRYRRPDTPSEVYLFKTVAAADGGPTSFFLARREGETRSAGVDLGPLGSCGPLFLEVQDFFEVSSSRRRT